MTEMIELPAPILDFVVAQIRRYWAIGGRRDAEPIVHALPTSLPAGAVHRLASGGPFGWMMDARIDRLGERVALEVLEDDRMSGPNHYRVWQDGTREPLPTEQTMLVYPQDSTLEQRQQIEQDYYAHNRTVGAELHERGFYRRDDG